MRKFIFLFILVFTSVRLEANDLQEDRSGFMLNVYFSLHNYANNHKGWFPQSGEGNFRALQKLYPEYSGATELAGLSGDVTLIQDHLTQGKPLTDKQSSWYYVQGLRIDDDPRIALLWESKTGYYVNGKKNTEGGRPVIFLNSTRTNISDTAWPAFLKEQEILKKIAIEKHSITNQTFQPGSN